MKNTLLQAFAYSGIIAALFAFMMVPRLQAHEVYVLDQDEIATTMSEPPLDFSPLLDQDFGEIAISVIVITLGIVVAFFLSISGYLERLLDPLIFRIKPFASYISEAIFGLSLISSAYFGAFFGPELPMTDVFGTLVPLIRILFAVCGVLLVVGILPRTASAVFLAISAIVIGHYGFYIANYGVYLGDGIVFLLCGSSYSLMRLKHVRGGGSDTLSRITDAVVPYKFFIIRIFFGFSLVYTAVYAKYLHGALALETVMKYQLMNYFPFDPLFIVFGALMVELAIGFFLMFGFELRLTSFVYLVFLTLSLIFFKEAVWPHLILFGSALTMLIHGYDAYTIEGKLYKPEQKEPVF